MANANITNTTRELWLRTVRAMVFLQMPLYAALLDKRRMRWKSGTAIQATVDYAEFDDMAQEYAAGEGLDSETKTFAKKVYWNWKFCQLPLSYGIEEYIQNTGDTDTSPVNLIPYLVKKAQRGMRIKLYKMMLDSASSTTDSDAGFQGLADALDHATTYGHLARTTSAYTWWNGISRDGTWTDQNTQLQPTISNWRTGMDLVTKYADKPVKKGDVITVMGSTNYRKFQAEAEARHVYDREGAGLSAKYGFEGMMIDGVEFVKDQFFDSNPNSGSTSDGTYTPEWMATLNIQDFELRMHPRRAMKMTDLVWQAEQAGGVDEWLARVLLAGNFVCHKPNGSLLDTYVLAS